MVNLYFSQEGITHSIPCNAGYLDRLVHASFIDELRESVVGEENLLDAKHCLDDLSEFEQANLDNFVPRGSPFFVSAGHNGYTWEGERRSYTIDLSGVDEEIVMSKGFIGSGSSVYIPMLQVKKRESTTIESVDSFPMFMIYNGGAFVEAEYDIKTASFVAKENSPRINPESLRMLNSPQQKSDYVVNHDTMNVPDDRKKSWIPMKNWLLEQTIGPFVLIAEIGRRIARGTAFWNMPIDHFHYQIKQHFSARGNFLRAIFPKGDAHRGWITKDQIDSFSHASYDEIGNVARMFKIDGFGYNLNRFLLYKAFEQTKQGNFIVGRIEGDSHRIHLPYVPVEKRD